MKSKTSFFERFAAGKTNGGAGNPGGNGGAGENSANAALSFTIPHGAPLKGLTPRGLFNRTLFLKNLTRNWPLWGLASFFIALFPLAILSEYLRHGANGLWGRVGHVSPSDFTELYYMGVVAAPAALLIYSVCCAMLVWGYLYNARSVGLMHTLPIRREGLFVTNFLSGLTMIAIPCVVGALFCILTSLVMGAFDPKGLFVTILAVAGESFFYFTTATAAAFVTGNIFALPFLYFIFHFLAPLCDLLISTISSFLIFGLEGQEYTGAVEFLSPTMYLMRHIRVDTQHERLEKISELNGSTYYENHLSSVALENVWLIAIYALVGVGLLAIALILYRLRRSESAGDVIAVNWAKPVFRYGVTAVMAVGGGQLLYLMFWNGFDQPGRYTLLPLIICMIIAGLMGYYIASMLLAKTLRVFKGSWPGAVAVAMGCVILCSVLYFDGFGIASRIPADSRIESVYLNVAGNSYNLYPETDAELIAQLKELQRAIVEDVDYIQNIRYYGSDFYAVPRRGEAVERTSESVRLIYYLKNGLQVARRYFLPLDRERMNTPGSYDYLLDQYVNGEGMKNKRLHAGDPRYKLTGGTLYIYHVLDRGNDVQFSSRELEQIITALQQDTAAGAWDYTWFDDVDSVRYAMNIQLEFVREEEGYNHYDYITVYPKVGMDHTIAALKDMGYITDSDLISMTEFYRLQSEADEARETYYNRYGYYPEEARDDPVDVLIYGEDYDAVEGITIPAPDTQAVPAVPVTPDPAAPDTRVVTDDDLMNPDSVGEINAETVLEAVTDSSSSSLG